MCEYKRGSPRFYYRIIQFYSAANIDVLQAVVSAMDDSGTRVEIIICKADWFSYDMTIFFYTRKKMYYQILWKYNFDFQNDYFNVSKIVEIDLNTKKETSE